MAHFETRVSVECSPEKAYAFLARPANVARISPPDLGLTMVDAPEIVELGSRIEFRVQGFGKVQTFVHEITALIEHRQITEEQVQGLFGHWVHDHIFESRPGGGVDVIDCIDFEPPSGLLAFLITKDRILDQLAEGFEHRHEQLKQLLAGP
jgi:ligand-binding SRPBCC domain-containing protein